MNVRIDSRKYNEIRKINLVRNYLPNPEGSCLVEMGQTRVITTATVENSVPQWLRGSGGGWVTAEYGMLPRSTDVRKRRFTSAGHPDGRSMEIQRLIGRTLRTVTDLEKLGERTVYIDCDVVNADGGTRVASIIGAAVALHDAGTWLVNNDLAGEQIVRELVAGISIGIIDKNITVDMCYEEDSSAEVDMNIVMTESWKFVEVQGTAEGKTFDRDMLNEMLDSAQSVIKEIIEIQKAALELT